MTVTEHYGDQDMTARIMALCSDATVDEDGNVIGEPTEAALVRWTLEHGIQKTRLSEDMPRIAEIPFDSGRKMMSTFHKDGEHIVQYTKGAPDEVLERCSFIYKDGSIVPITETQTEKKFCEPTKPWRTRPCVFYALRFAGGTACRTAFLPKTVKRN